MTTPVDGTVVNVGGRDVPIVGPNANDPRLHTAAVIISIHLIGIFALGFDVSIPQVAVAIVAAGAIDITVTFWGSGKLVWPASGMLTGSGVALILRMAGTGPATPWSWSDWHVYAGVSIVAVATKHLVRWRGEHLFNPSNVALVAAFLILGSDFVEPLDFWWAPLDAWMMLAYALIVLGGVVVTGRLGLLAMATTFWVALALALGVLVAGGHCMTTTWSLTPVCGSRFWWSLVTSPEILVFMFFMITDPKTIPLGRRPRLWFAASIAILATLLIAPQTVEFGAKVGLLASLVVLSPARRAFDRLQDIPRPRLENLMIGGSAAAAAIIALILLLGLPARFPAPDALSSVVDSEPVPEVPIPQAAAGISIESLPAVTVDGDVDRLDAEAASSADELARMLIEDLIIEREAMIEGDLELLRVSTSGQRYLDIVSQLEAASTEGLTLSSFSFDRLHLRVVEAQSGQSVSLGFDAFGTVETIRYDIAHEVIDERVEPFAGTFLIRRLGGDRWRIVHHMDEGST